MNAFILFTATAFALSGAIFLLIRGIDKDLAELDEAER